MFLERIRRRAKKQDGFTLIELLVVVIIIGLLAAIAIPAFLGQRDKANDAAAKSLVRNGATAIEAYFAEGNTYAGADAAALGNIEPNIVWTAAAASANNDEVQISGVAATGYTLTSVSSSGTTYNYIKDTTAAGSTVQRTCAGPGCSGGTW